MKKIFLVAVVGLVFCISGCNDGGENTENTQVTDSGQSESKALKGMIMISLLDYGLPIWVTVPDTLMAPLDIKVQDWGQVEVRSGKSYQVSVAEGGDLELKKSDIKSDLLYSDSKFIIDEPEGVVYSQGVKDDEYFKPLNHFYVVKTINGVNYEFTDIQGEDNYPEKVVIKMFEACKVAEADDRKPS